MTGRKRPASSGTLPFRQIKKTAIRGPAGGVNGLKMETKEEDIQGEASIHNGHDEAQVNQNAQAKPKNITHTPTKEQELILNSTSPFSTGKVFRVTAAAGTGKTTTLELLAQKLVTESSQKVLYIVFNKAAQMDATARFQSRLGIEDYGRVECRTMHSVALESLYGDDGEEENPAIRNQIWQDEHALQQRIAEMYEEDILRIVRNPQRKKIPDKPRIIRQDVKTVAFWIYKTLVFFCQSWGKLEQLTRDVDNRGQYFYTYYPCKLKHVDKFGIPPDAFYVKKAKDLWDKMADKTIKMTHDFYMKQAQLAGLRNVTQYGTVLVDESQDLNQCQVDLFIKQQARSRKNIYVVGDSVQSIFGFRGAKPHLLKDLEKDRFINLTQFHLTNSFRFGKHIASIANQLLFIKENSPQGPKFDSYRVTGLSSFDGKIIRQTNPPPTPFTSIARTNCRLIIRCVELLSKNPEYKIAINGDEKKFKKAAEEVLDLLRFKNGERPKSKFFQEFESFAEFEKAVEDQEMQNYYVHLGLINEVGDNLPNVIRSFQENVLDKKVKKEDADVLVTTCHQVKGLEYDHVEVLDDFIDLELIEGKPQYGKRRVEFGLKDYGDDLNLWYVAVTRPKKVLSLSEKWWALQDDIMETKMLAESPGEEDDYELVCLKKEMYDKMQRECPDIPLNVGY